MTDEGLRAGQSWVGDPLPPISRLTLALYCGASGDHNPLHVDIDAARAAGFDDVIAHGMLPMAYLGRFVTELFPQDRVRQFGVRFVAMTHVGEVLTPSAECVEVDTLTGSAVLAVQIAGAEDEIKAVGRIELTPNSRLKH